MKRSILEQYIDACELIKETERDIDALEKKHTEVVHDKVYGSNPEFPYEARGFNIYGAADADAGDQQKLLTAEYRLLAERKAKAKKLKASVEEWMNTLPPRIVRIIRYHFFQGLTWESTARKLGKNATAESVRKEFERFFKEI